MPDIASNIPKIFCYLLTQRRNFIPLLSIYFLSIPNTTANQIGIFMWIGALLGFALEIPSGYISDKFGHKRILVVAKILTIFSTGFFILWGLFTQYAFVFFTLGAIAMSLWYSFTSGTISAFIHDTLIYIKKDHEFTKIYSKMRANVSLLSVGFILIFPFFTQINILTPFYIALGIDIIGLFIALSLTSVRHQDNNTSPKLWIKSVIQQAYHLHLLPFAIFTWAIAGIDFWLSPFRGIYLESLWFPIIFIGTVMGLSRLTWFWVGHYAHIIQEKTSFRGFLILKMSVSILGLIGVVLFQNPYVVGVIFALVNGFWWWVSWVAKDYIFKHYTGDSRYKATIISLSTQVNAFFQIATSFVIGYIVSAYSYEAGYFIAAVSMWAICIMSYPFIKIKKK